MPAGADLIVRAAGETDPRSLWATLTVFDQVVRWTALPVDEAAAARPGAPPAGATRRLVAIGRLGAPAVVRPVAAGRGPAGGG